MENKRYIIYNGIEEQVGTAETITEICDVIGCSTQHWYNTFNGSTIMKGGTEYKIIDTVAYYWEHYYRHEM